MQARGQALVFEEGSGMLEELLGLDVSAKRIQRVSEHYGGKFDDLIRYNCEAVIPNLNAKDKKRIIIGVEQVGFGNGLKIIIQVPSKYLIIITPKKN